MKSRTKFEVVGTNELLAEAIKPALEAANKAFQQGIDKRGVVIAQVFILDDGKVRIVGDFIENKWATPIFDALTNRANS
jgi:hypothetical protein